MRDMAETLEQPVLLDVVEFDPAHAAEIAGWIVDERELCLLAPSTKPPLTAAAVIDWKKPGGSALVLLDTASPEPIAYGELNPMRRETRHVWLGHVIVRPDLRGQGLGRRFVQALVDHGFAVLHATHISLIVFPSNTAAINCYLRVGFRQVSDEYHAFNGSARKHRLVRLEIRSRPPKSVDALRATSS